MKKVFHWFEPCYCCRGRHRRQKAQHHHIIFPLQFVCEAQRFLASVFWLIQWRRAFTQPLMTAVPKEAAWAPLWQETRTTNCTATSARVSAQRSRSGWASTTWWLTASGWTIQGPACATRTGRQRSPCSRTEGADRTAPSSPLQPTGSGLMRAAELKRPRCASSTSSEGCFGTVTSLYAN